MALTQHEVYRSELRSRQIAHSFGASKNVAGWVLAVCSMVSRPCSCQTSAKSFRKPCENAVPLPTGRPFGLPETPGGHGFKLRCNSIVSHCRSVKLCGSVLGEGGDMNLAVAYARLAASARFCRADEARCPTRRASQTTYRCRNYVCCGDWYVTPRVSRRAARAECFADAQQMVRAGAKNLRRHSSIDRSRSAHGAGAMTKSGNDNP